MIKLALSTNNKSFSYRDTIEIARTIGFDGIDYYASVKDLYYPSKQLFLKELRKESFILGVHQPAPLIIKTPSFFLKECYKQ